MPVPAQIPRQRSVPSKKKIPSPAPPSTRTLPATIFIGPLPQTPPVEFPVASYSPLETSEGGRGPSAGPRPMESTMTMRSRDTNKRNVPDDVPEEDARQQPKKKVRQTSAAETTAGEIEVESDDGDRSSADSLFDDDASKIVEAVS
jgi:hypothetical protein